MVGYAVQKKVQREGEQYWFGACLNVCANNMIVRSEMQYLLLKYILTLLWHFSLALIKVSTCTVYPFCRSSF